MTFAALIDDSRTRCEDWHYTSLEPYATLVTTPCAVGALPQLPEALSRHRLVFVDGVYQASVSSLGALPDGFISPCDTTDTCCSITLSDQTCLAIDPLELLFLSTDAAQANEAATQIKIALGANSRLTVIERHLTAGNMTAVREIAIEIALEQQSKLVHGKIVSGDDTAFHFSRTKVAIAEGAFYDHFVLIGGGRLTRCESSVTLSGALASTRLHAVQLLRDTHHADITTLVRHEAPHATSRQICKAVVADKAHGVFQGKIHVAKGAQKTDGYQLCRALLLSDKAEMDAKPELEIYADDVKCSHGTTIGDLDENALFYLMSRGIPLPQARAMLVQAFVGELVDQLPAGELQTAVQEEVAQWLNP